VTVDRDGRAAARATSVAFVSTGFAFASWASRIPQVRDHLHLSPAELGLVLLTVACGSFISLPLTGTMIDHVGSSRTVAVMAVIVGFALATVAFGYLIGTLPVVIGLFAFGFSAGAWDVAMNVQAASVERRLERSIMSRFHAGFSVGSVAGALIGAAMVALHVPVTAHLAVVAVAVGIVVPWSVRAFLPDHVTDPGDPSQQRPAGPSALARWREPHTLLVGLFVLAFAFSEGAGNDWLGIGLIDGHHTPAFVGTLGYALFLAAMTTGRWFGPTLIDTYGRVVVIRAIALVGIVGVLVFVFSPFTPLAFAGAALWGAGASLGFPIGMSAAADEPAAAAGRVSVVSSIGYCAFLVGPPTIGLLADQVDVLRALTLVAFLLAFAALIATSVRRPPAQLPPPDVVSLK
jgi:MFS family permease